MDYCNVFTFFLIKKKKKKKQRNFVVWLLGKGQSSEEYSNAKQKSESTFD